MIDVDRSNNTCGVFGSINGEAARTLTRFVVGEDGTPRAMGQDDMARELGDPFATLLLAKGVFPSNAEEVLTAIDDAVGPGDPLQSSSQRSFVLGEGSQLPVGPGEIQSTNRFIRFLVARGSDSQGPDLIISASNPRAGLVELMAWDRTSKGFNFYRTLGEQGSWVFAGNSRHALVDPTQGKGPFESHPTGNLLMKELKFPWVHWHSFKANIFDGVFPAGDMRRNHPWFTEKKSADICETAVVMPSIRRWTAARFDGAIGDDGVVTDPRRFVRQLLESSTVNLASSSTESARIRGDVTADLPPSLFVDSDALDTLGLPAPPSFAVSGQAYSASLETFDFMLTDREGFAQRGDSHFAFVVPERAFEDREVVSQAIDRGLITRRLAAALLMVDFPNPVFSARRAVLLGHAPTEATIRGGASTYSEEMATRIVAAADATPSGSAEREFAERWAEGDAWPAEFGALLSRYYDAVQGRLATQEGFNDYVRLAESRRNRVRDMPISEFPLLFPETNIARGDRAMRIDGTVVELPGTGAQR